MNGEALQELKDNLLLMGGIIESMLKESRQAAHSPSVEFARKVMERDLQVDKMEKDIDDQAISILSISQPVAKDLRFASAALKITTDIERMGDIIRNICERVEEIVSLPKKDLPEEILKLFDLTENAVEKSLDAFVEISSPMASEALVLDDEIDELHLNVFEDLIAEMKSNPELIETLLKHIYIAKNLERIADHAMNVAEQVIFVAEGLDVRHTDSEHTSSET